MVTSVTWWLPVVTMCYQRYQVLHDSMLCTRSTVTSVTWWLPVVTFGYQRYQVLHDSMLCTRGLWLPQLPGGYLWLLCVTSVTRYYITLCCVRGVRLPQLPGGYLWLLCVTSVTRYCMTVCCVCCILLPQLTLWVPVVILVYRCYLVLQDPRLYT